MVRAQCKSAPFWFILLQWNPNAKVLHLAISLRERPQNLIQS